MENQAKPAADSGSNSGSTLRFRSPATQAPPWTIMMAGYRPGPSGTEASSCRLEPPAWPNSTLSYDLAAAIIENAAIVRGSSSFGKQGVIILIVLHLERWTKWLFRKFRQCFRQDQRALGDRFGRSVFIGAMADSAAARYE